MTTPFYLRLNKHTPFSSDESDLGLCLLCTATTVIVMFPDTQNLGSGYPEIGIDTRNWLRATWMKIFFPFFFSIFLAIFDDFLKFRSAFRVLCFKESSNIWHKYWEKIFAQVMLNPLFHGTSIAQNSSFGYLSGSITTTVKLQVNMRFQIILHTHA